MLLIGTCLDSVLQVIEELAEWIDHAFDRYRPIIPESKERNGERAQTLLAPKATVMQALASPLTSETETDDTGITFVPRRQPEQVAMHRAITPIPESPPISDTTLEDDRKEEAVGVVGTRVQTPEKSSTPRQTGQTISESELMRRRRLLDAHIFE